VQGRRISQLLHNYLPNSRLLGRTCSRLSGDFGFQERREVDQAAQVEDTHNPISWDCRCISVKQISNLCQSHQGGILCRPSRADWIWRQGNTSWAESQEATNATGDPPSGSPSSSAAEQTSKAPEKGLKRFPFTFILETITSKKKKRFYLLVAYTFFLLPSLQSLTPFHCFRRFRFPAFSYYSICSYLLSTALGYDGQ